MTRLLLGALALLGAAAPLHAAQDIDIRDAWIRYLPGDRPVAGYFVMDNRGEAERRLTGASSPAFGAVHMHESMEQQGTVSMRPVEAVTVPRGGRLRFAPGGYHLMLRQRQTELAVGDRVPVTLMLDNGGVTVMFTVKPAWQE